MPPSLTAAALPIVYVSRRQDVGTPEWNQNRNPPLASFIFRQGKVEMRMSCGARSDDED